MKKWSIILSLVLFFIFLSACGGGEPAATETSVPTLVPTTAATPTQEPTPEPVLGEVEPVPLSEITGTTWLWTELNETEPASQSIVPNAVNYKLVFQEGNLFTYQADCNFGSGEFIENDGQLSLELGPITLAECGAESLHDQYLVSLASAGAYGMRDGKLVLVTNDGASQMVFEDGGTAAIPETDLDSCSGIQLDSVNIDTMELASSWASHCIPATSYDNSQPPGPTGMPEHVLITFGVEDPGELLAGDPQLHIIPIDAYMQQWEANGDLTITDNVQELRNLLAARPTPIPNTGMPILPPNYPANDLAVQGEYLDTSLGSGVRYVGRFAQDLNPVTNEGYFYVFQGFTSDGVYLISFIYPVTSQVLPPQEEITEDELLEMEADPEGYLAAKAEELNTLPPSDWEPDLTELDAVIDSLEFEYQAPEPSTAPRLTNIKWQWTELIGTEPASQSVVPNYENYVLIFLSDQTFDILADCNFGNGAYTLDGNAISLEVIAVTQINCGEASLSTQFVELLRQVATYELATNNLTLFLAENGGNLGLINGGPALIVSPPEEGVPTATTQEPLNVRSGPGTAYTSYGTVPSGTTFAVIGISEDSTWWIVSIPTDVAPDGQGWISAAYVTTENTENVPIVPTPPIGEGGAPTPEPDVPTATALEPINVRSGPGTAYLSYGIAPAGSTAIVVGVSEDGQWWVIQLPTDVSPEGQGWVSGEFVEVRNVENVPIIPPPPLP